MLEALERIKSAEEQNEQRKEQLMTELLTYEDSKKQSLQEQREQLRAEFSDVLAKREQVLAQKLETEEQDLARNAEEAIKLMEENYHSKQQETIQKIIERVISEYGS